MSSQASAAFRRLHAPGQLLVLPNAWDAASARLIESVGATAIATTSSGVCWARGYPDGKALPLAVLVGAVAEIVRVTRLPVSADVEAGYSADPQRVAETVSAVIGAGAVGINLEDGSAPPELLAAKITAVKQAARRAGVDLFVNARTDVYLKRLAPPERAVAETIARGKRYQEAGCDGLFVPGLSQRDAIQAIAAASRCRSTSCCCRASRRWRSCARGACAGSARARPSRRRRSGRRDWRRSNCWRRAATSACSRSPSRTRR